MDSAYRAVSDRIDVGDGHLGGLRRAVATPRRPRTLPGDGWQPHPAATRGNLQFPQSRGEVT
jgi:hypothetical protein